MEKGTGDRHLGNTGKKREMAWGWRGRGFGDSGVGEYSFSVCSGGVGGWRSRQGDFLSLGSGGLAKVYLPISLDASRRDCGRSLQSTQVLSGLKKRQSRTLPANG